ncbi:probable RNA-directed DNA polymerase from transposon X-element [Trichonephila clavipes]|nr:probable RNA-directed DNA polymerase from transposon X-element [Trichonephila clavipes]
MLSKKKIKIRRFKDNIRDIERLNRVPTAASPASQQKRKQAKRQTASPRKDVPSKKQAKSEQTLPPNSTSPRHIGDAESSMEEGETSADESSEEVGIVDSVKPVIAPSSPAAKAASSVSAPGASEKDDGFITVGRNGRRIAPIVIDAQSNATELLDQIGKLCDTPLEGRFENGKLRIFPTSAEEHRLIQKFISDKKLRSHTFEMAHNKQLKVVLRGLPTDSNQEELMSELHSFGFQPNHISLLRNRKTNTNMPLILVTLPKSPEMLPLSGVFSSLSVCARAPKCLKCSGGHLTSECTKSDKAPAKCANCSDPHPANFSGCPKNLNNTKPNKNKPTKNVWQERAAARKENEKQPTAPSFAEVVKKGTNNNSLDAKEVMTQMAQMMTQWGQMLSDRSTHRGGGTALFVKNSIRHHAILNVSNTFENSSVIIQIGNNSKITVACIYRPPHRSINTTELDAILNHSNKAFLFGDFNAKHPSWSPGRANTNGNILCNWAVASALDILAPDTPTHFNTYHTNAILDIGFAVNLFHTEVFTINELSSDHNPVIFDFAANNVLPPILRTLKSTNWTKFQEIIYHNIPGNPQIDDLDLAVQNFTRNISNAISASTSTRLINTPNLRLPENIRGLIRAKNRFSKLWNNTRYPPYKRKVNALIRQIRSEIQEHKNRTWKNFLLTLNPEDNSLYNLHRKFSKRHIPFPTLHGPGGMTYSDFEKAEAFKDTLEVTFQENEEPYCDEKIEVENLVDHYFDNFATYTPPLTSPSEHSTVSTCLFADDSAVLSQGVQLKYTIKTVQHFLDKLETWLTHWRIAINVDKSQAIVFRKWGVIDPPFQLTLFDDNVQWVSVVKYLGLHIDSRLTFKKHIDYLSEKFWGRISLAISLIGGGLLYPWKIKLYYTKQILRPVTTYGSPVWGAAAATHMKKIQVMQNKFLRVMTNATLYVRNDVIHNDLHMEPISNYITKLSRNVFKSIESHDNPIIKAQTLFTYPHPKIKYSYSSTKWRNPLRPP